MSAGMFMKSKLSQDSDAVVLQCNHICSSTNDVRSALKVGTLTGALDYFHMSTFIAKNVPLTNTK